jgi:predicted GIY-YIG superfamily endonuclease
MFWVYIVQNLTGVFYVGHTDNLRNRVASHTFKAINELMSQNPNVKQTYVQISSFEELIFGLLGGKPRAAWGDINF